MWECTHCHELNSKVAIQCSACYELKDAQANAEFKHFIHSITTEDRYDDKG